MDKKEFTMKQKIIAILAGIAGLAAVLLIVVGVSKFIFRQTDETQASQSSDAELQQTEPATVEKVTDASQDSETVTESAEPEEEIPIDFEELWETNPDVYAWIVIPGTDINYPILQHPTDDSYYLNHNIDGSTGRPACIYTCLLYTSPSPRDLIVSRMPSSA